jgi:hypothetical protein
MTTALVRFLGSGVIHQETAHHLSSESNEVSPAAGFGRSLPKNLHVNFVDESSRLKRMIRAFPPQLVGGHAPQITVQEVEEPAFRGSISAKDSLQ